MNHYIHRDDPAPVLHDSGYTDDELDAIFDELAKDAFFHLAG